MRTALLPALLLVVACGGATSGPAASSASPPSSTASAAPLVFVADLTSALPASDPESSCTGSVRVTIDPTKRPPLQLVTASFELVMRGCASDTEIVGAHVHPVNESGPVRIDALIDRLSLPGGAGTGRSTNPGVNPRAVDEISADPSAHIFNLHTTRHPGGGVRGTLRRGS